MDAAIYGLTSDFVFRAAAEFLSSREAVPMEVYKQLQKRARDRAFSVSGYTSAEVLNQFLRELVDAIEDGTTFVTFRENMNDFLERNGYTATNAWHLSVIYHTNLQTAFNAGHYENMQAAKKFRPYWQYKTAGDGHVRESHAAMQDRVYAADDPIWDIWYPPNGFRCRCTVVSLSKEQVEERGLTVSDSPPTSLTGSKPVFPDKGFSNNPATTPLKPDTSNFDPTLKSILKEKTDENGESIKN